MIKFIKRKILHKLYYDNKWHEAEYIMLDKRTKDGLYMIELTAHDRDGYMHTYLFTFEESKHIKELIDKRRSKNKIKLKKFEEG